MWFLLWEGYFPDEKRNKKQRGMKGTEKLGLENKKNKRKQTSNVSRNDNTNKH